MATNFEFYKDQILEIAKKMFGLGCRDCDHDVNKLVDDLIENGVTMQEWVSVDERLPITEKEAMEYYEINSEFPQFIVKIDVGVTAAMLEFNGKDWFDGYATYNVTHWMPLPALPKGAQ